MCCARLSVSRTRFRCDVILGAQTGSDSFEDDGRGPHIVFVGIDDFDDERIAGLQVVEAFEVFGIDKYAAIDFRCVGPRARDRAFFDDFIDQALRFACRFCAADALR